MSRALSGRRLPWIFAVAVVLFAFWHALFAGGSLVSADIVATAPPFDAHQPESFTLENGPGDPINIHAHWGSLAADVRSGDVGWWDRDLAGGQPTMKGGLPVFDLVYLLVPAWFAPGLVAAVRALVAAGLSAGFLRAVGVGRLGALAGGLAYAFSGFMVGWMNWPHSSVAALAPGLLWAVERAIVDPRPWRAAPLAVVVAAMVWANFPPVTIYVLLGVALYALVRLAGEARGAAPVPWRAAGVGLVGGGLALLMASPHLVGFADYLDWADTSHRVTGVDDSSAGIAYLMTAVSPAIWGSDATGPAWFGEGNWVEFNAHAGASVVMLAALGLVATLARRREHDASHVTPHETRDDASDDAPGRGEVRAGRSVAVGLAAMIGLGVLVAYAGGPVAVALGDLTGNEGGLMTRAKVLWSLGIALAAGLGVDELARGRSTGQRVALTRAALRSGALLCAVVLVLAPSIVDWEETAQGLGVFREAIAASTAPAVAALAVVVIVVARVVDRLTPAATGWALTLVITYELLSFAMPVPTTVDRAERLTATPAHDVVADVLGPGERLAGEGRTFFPATTELFDIDDARGQVLKSPGYQELLRAVDPDMLRRAGGGTPTYPNIAIGTDVSNPVWDAMAVGAWAQFRETRPPGTIVWNNPPVSQADPSLQPLRGRIEVPPGGLRAVLLEVMPAQAGLLKVRVAGAGVDHTEERWIEPVQIGEISIAVPGEDVEPGTMLRVTVTSASPPGGVIVGVDGAGAPAVGTVAGSDGLRLIRAGDVIVIERPQAHFARLVDAVHVEADPAAAARLVASRTPGVPVAVVAADVRLPDTPDPDARLEVTDVRVDADVTEVSVRTDRDALLVLAQNDYPGWSATVDGGDAAIVTADASFTAVAVPAGEHVVRLEFHPTHLRVTGLLATIGLLGTLVLWRRGRRGDLRSSVRPAR